MSLIEHLLEKPRSLSRDAKYTVLNGVAYFAVGTLLIAWPGVTQTVFRDAAFAGHEEALMRVIGLTVAVIGWPYFWRSFWRPAIRRRLRGRQIGIRAFGADTLGDRRRIPPPLHYIHAAGRIPRHRGVGPACSRMNVRKGSLADVTAPQWNVR